MSWKKYGGTNKLEKLNNITINSLVTDTFTLRQAYFGDYDICGSLNVSDFGYINKDLTVNGNLYTNNNVIVEDETDISGNLTVQGDFTLKGNFLSKSSIFLGADKKNYLFGDPSGVGLNISTPQSVFDISGNRAEGINIKVYQPTNTNILARNITDKGIMLNTEDTISYIDFFNDVSINHANTYDARLKYTQGGVFSIDVSSDTQIYSRMAISNRNQVSHVNNETTVIYDTSNGNYLFDVFNNSNSNVGNALSLISLDTSSIAFMHFTTPDSKGMIMGGGAFPNDFSRSFGTIGLSDSNGTYRPIQSMVSSGNSFVKYRNTTGFNKYVPITESYVVDINGPVKIDNGEVSLLLRLPYEVNSMNIINSVGIAVGSPNPTINNSFNQLIYYTLNAGKTWILNDITGGDLESLSVVFNSSSIYENYTFFGGSFGFLFYSNNNGANIKRILNGPGYTIRSLYANYRNLYVFGSTQMSYFSLYDTSFVNFLSNYEVPPSNLVNLTPPITSIRHSSGNETEKVIYIAGSGITKFDSSNNTFINGSTYPHNVGTQYNCVTSYDGIYTIAVGVNIISYTTDGTNWTNITSFTSGPVTFNSVYILDTNQSIAVGNSGIIYITKNGGITWLLISNDVLNVSGNASSLTDPSNNLTSVMKSDEDSFVISCTTQTYVFSSRDGKSQLFYCFIPNLFNRGNNRVLDVCGNMFMSGDLNINDNGKIMTNNENMYLLNENVKNMFFANYATSIFIGNANAKGNTYIQQQLDVSDNTNLHSNLTVDGIEYILNQTESTGPNTGALQVHGGATVNGNTNIGGNLYLTNIAYLNNGEENNGANTGALQISSGGAYIHGNTHMGGNLHINSTFDTMSQGTGALSVAGTATIGGNLLLNMNSSMFVNNITAIPHSSINGNTLNIGCDTTTTNTINIGKSLPTTIINIGNVNDVNSNYVDTPSTINIGGLNDVVILRGNLYLPPFVSTVDVSNLQIVDKVIQLNHESVGLNQSAGAGIIIRDNSNNYASHILVSNDLNGFLLKAPNVFGGNNVVNMNINALKFENMTMTNSGSGLLVLKRTSDLVDPQTDSEYTIVAENVLNSVFKIDDTTPSTEATNGALQVTGGAGIIGNTNIGGILKVASPVIINKASNITGTYMDISGTAIFSRLGVATSQVNNNFELDLNGNMNISNGFISQF